MPLHLPKRALLKPTRRKLIIGGAALIAAPAIVRAQSLLMTGVGGGSAGGAVTYTGPGDIVGLDWWGGLRAYNATKAAALTNVCQISAANGSNTLNIPCLATGLIDVTGSGPLQTYITANGAAYVNILYAQVDTSLALDMSFSPRPQLSIGGANGPSATAPWMDGTSNGFAAGPTPSNFTGTTLPISIIGVARGLNNAGANRLLLWGGGGSFLGISGSANTWEMQITGAATFAGILDANYHSIVGVFDAAGTTPLLFNNGSSVTASGGAGLGPSAGILKLFGTQNWSGYACEVGIANGDISSHAAALSSNARSATTGYNF